MKSREREKKRDMRKEEESNERFTETPPPPPKKKNLSFKNKECNASSPVESKYHKGLFFCS